MGCVCLRIHSLTCEFTSDSVYPDQFGDYRPACTAYWVRIQCALITSALQARKTKPDRMHIEPINFWRWIESGLEWNIRICVVACLQFRPISATTQMRGFGKDMPTSCSYHVVIWGHAHVLLSHPLCKVIVQTWSKVDWNRFQQCAFNPDLI